VGDGMLQAIARATIKHFPVEIGFAATRALASRAPRPTIAAHEAAALERSSQIHCGSRAGDIAWAWGAGPSVVLIHGWGGRAAQMAPLAEYLAGQGFRSIAFDVAGHGTSREPQARWEWFIRDIAAVAECLGEVAAFVGHSAGGLAMMAARNVKGIRAGKYVCICAPSYPYPPIRGIERRLNPGRGVLERYKTYLGEQFQSSWAALEAGSAFAGAGRDLLLCYDEKDRFIDHSEGDRIQALCPGSTHVKTSTYGHTRILAAPELMQAIGEFLRSPVN
jgi:pimeloyl-ACP methyl ester carboxylesterase